MTMRKSAQSMVNAALRPLRVQVIRSRSTDPAVANFRGARKTIHAATAAGLSVRDYIDLNFAKPGATSAAVEAMLDLAKLESPVERVCEIGPGTGRFLELVVEALQPKVYEIYETATDWLPHLRGYPGVVERPCDGRTLAGTASGSVDLVHAQKVFVYLPFWTVAGYLDEMARVVRPGGVVAFDIVTEQCITDEVLEGWKTSGTVFKPVPREWTIAYLADRGLVYLGNHIARLPEGECELLVFRRSDSPS